MAPTFWGLFKHLERVSEKANRELSLPTGIPIVYELDRNMKPSKPVQFLGHEETVCKAMEAVCPGQGQEGRASTRLLPRIPSLPPPLPLHYPLAHVTATTSV